MAKDPTNEGGLQIENLIPPPPPRRIVKVAHPVSVRETVLSPANRGNDDAKTTEIDVSTSKPKAVLDENLDAPADDRYSSSVERRRTNRENKLRERRETGKSLSESLASVSWNPMSKAAWFSVFTEPNHKRANHFDSDEDEPNEKRLRKNEEPASGFPGSVQMAALGAVVACIAISAIFVLKRCKK